MADADVEITSEKLQALAKAADIQDVEPVWVDLFAKAIAKQDIVGLMTKFEAGAAPAGGAAPAAAAGGAAAEEEKKEEKVEEESDEDMGMGLFD